MKFIEKRNIIKPVNLKDTAYIREFNQFTFQDNSFFLKSIDWDMFTMFMGERKPDSLMVLEYTA